jgi:hypothetical protein
VLLAELLNGILLPLPSKTTSIINLERNQMKENNPYKDIILPEEVSKEEFERVTDYLTTIGVVPTSDSTQT